MRSRLLVRHFLSQFVETDLSADADRHQVLALTAAALITLPLFVTVFMGMKYLMRPLQAPGWTETTAMGDEITFCATSMLVAAIVATLEWDALALSARDSMILGVLPVAHRLVVRAKVVSLLTFAAAFVFALNALPTLLHPALMVANLPLNPLMLLPLMAAQGLSTTMAGALGFSCVVGLRESLYLFLGQRGYSRMAGVVRSVLLFCLLVLLAMVPLRVSGRADWMFEPAGGPLMLRPVSWFAAAHGAIVGRVLERLPQPDLPPWLSSEEGLLRTQYRHSLPHLTALAVRGAGVLAGVLTLSLATYLWNARRLHLLPEGQGATAMFGMSRVSERLATALARQPARRAGLLFLARTVLGNPTHRIYLIASVAASVALLNAMAPAAAHGAVSAPVRTSALAAQTLMLTAIVAGFRAAIGTSADSSAGWLFGVAETGNIGEFRNGVRLGMITAIIATVLLLVPLHAAAWGGRIASMHAVTGAAVGWLLVEVVFAGVEQPLVWTIPPSDGVNTVGVVFLGALVILVFVLAHIERGVLTAPFGCVAFVGAMVLLALWVRNIGDRNYRAETLASIAELDSDHDRK